MTRAASSNGCGPLRQALETARNGDGLTMDALTVLSPQNDPYRQDTPAGHREARWFQRRFNAAIAARGKPTLHLRGVHYAIVAAGRVRKPNGKPYTNTDENWRWLQESAAKAARWLGYVPFASITDHRADAPILRPTTHPPSPWTEVDTAQIARPAVGDDLTPVPHLYNFEGRQPFRLVIFGEKSSLADVVAPIAARYGADLFLETGEISDSHVYEMAAAGAADGRPMRILTLADCDPAGHQMPISIARKLQALRDLEFPDLAFEVVRVSLTVAQVRALQLPSTPLKASEQRADKWRAAFGVEQTEIDALASLNPTALADLLTDAIRPFYDHTLDARVARAVIDWRRQAQAVIDDQVDADALAAIHDDLRDVDDQLEAIDSRLQELVPDDLPPTPAIPDPVIPEAPRERPLISSAWPWAEQTRRLKVDKAYATEEDE